MPKTPAESDNRIAEFERSLNELEALVVRMEQGELSLDESLKSYERGIALYRNCQGALDEAELKIKQLADPALPDSAQDFEADAP
ncbi:MAG: exodeoxyribonuclease VII small subunit [Rhodanobacteraceae bacterium]